MRAVWRWFVRYRRAPQRVLLGTARSRAGGVVKSLSALCCRVCNTVTRCARSVGSQVTQWWSGGVVRGNFDAYVQRGRVCGHRSFTRGRGLGDFFRTPLAKALLPPSAFLSSLIPFVSRTYCSTNCDNRVFPHAVGLLAKMSAPRRPNRPDSRHGRVPSQQV